MNNLIKREDAIDKILEVYEYEFPTASGAFDEFVTMIIPNILRNLPSIEPKGRTAFKYDVYDAPTICAHGAHEEGKLCDTFYQDCPLGLYEEEKK